MEEVGKFHVAQMWVWSRGRSWIAGEGESWLP